MCGVFMAVCVWLGLVWGDDEPAILQPLDLTDFHRSAFPNPDIHRNRSVTFELPSPRLARGNEVDSTDILQGITGQEAGKGSLRVRALM